MSSYDNLSTEDKIRVHYVLDSLTGTDAKGRTLDEAAKAAANNPAEALTLERYITDKINELTSPQNLASTLKQADELLALRSTTAKAALAGISSKVPANEKSWQAHHMRQAARIADEQVDIVDLHGIQYHPVETNTEGAKLFKAKDYGVVLEEARAVCNQTLKDNPGTVRNLENLGIDMQCSTVPATQRQGQNTKEGRH